jgi:hypothetical protein
MGVWIIIYVAGQWPGAQVNLEGQDHAAGLLYGRAQTTAAGPLLYGRKNTS